MNLQHSIWLTLCLLLIMRVQPNFAQEVLSTTTVHASEMQFSKNVTEVGDHVVIWGMGRKNYAWIAYPSNSVPYSTFSVTVEARADTADARWPILGIAFNDSSNLQTQQQVMSVDWQPLTFGPLTPAKTDSLIFFVFTNDYHNSQTDQDLNLEIRNIEFQELKLQPVRVSWNPNQEPYLAGYKIYYGTRSGGYSDTIDVGLTTEKILYVSAREKTYFFAVTAYGPTVEHESDFSEEVTYEIEEPSVAIDCDLDENGTVDLRDWLAFQASFDSQEGETRFLANADFNQDGRIDQKDETIANDACFADWGLSSN